MIFNFFNFDVKFNIDLVVLVYYLKLFHLQHDKSVTPTEPLLYFVAV